jgi:activator of HSP90 ATPase
MSDQNKSPLPAPTRRQILASAAALGALSMASIKAIADESGISHADSIHQEPVFKASRQQVYETLTDAKKFDQVSRISEAMRTMAPGGKPTEISSESGGAFSLFGGYITGRHIELVRNERIVQAWRSAWKPGAYSIVEFVLVEEGSGTKIIFDHRGFPDGTAQHLAEGWKANYWEPMEKFFAQK